MSMYFFQKLLISFSRSMILVTTSRLGYSGITRLLLQFRAETWSWDADGMTALMLACAGGHAEVVSQLTDAEVNANA